MTSKVKTLGVTIEGFRIEDLLKEKFMTLFKEEFPEFEVNVIGINIALPEKPKITPPSSGTKGTIITIASSQLNTLTIHHRNSGDYAAKKVAASSTNEDLTERFINLLLKIADS